VHTVAVASVISKTETLTTQRGCRYVPASRIFVGNIQEVGRWMPSLPASRVFIPPCIQLLLDCLSRTSIRSFDNDDEPEP
jgi:hypothetical protein